MDPRDKVVSTGYSSPMSKADWASALLLIVILITAASAYFTFQEIDLLERILEGEHVSEAEALSSDERIMFVGILWLGAYIIAGVFFFIWLHRACKNLDYLEVVDTRFTPGWAIGWWFIPFANLFMPYQVVKELWKTSDTNTVQIHSTVVQTAWKEAYTSPILILWWLLWITSSILGVWVNTQLSSINISDVSEPANIEIFTATMERVIGIDWTSIFSDVVIGVNAVLAIVIVRAISSRQDSRYSMIVRMRATENQQEF